jgi:RimJ/RimL family protein N-acetyltransferase
MTPKITLGDVPFESARAWRNSESVWRWCRQYTHLSEAEHQAWQARIATDPSIKMFGVYEQGRPVGTCGLTSINRVNQTAEFSLYIAPGHQKRGLGKAALIKLLAHGFFDHNLNLIFGETFDGNPALKVFEAVGMTKEATLRERYYRDGRFIDVHIVSMLRSDYERAYHSHRHNRDSSATEPHHALSGET